MPRTVALLAFCLAALLGAVLPMTAVAQEKSEPERFAAFGKAMNGVKLTGRYTILGKEAGEPKDEEYVINSVKKLAEGDYWLFDARISYGGKETPIQIPIEVKWSGDTPVITLENLTIPSLGTFSSRVVIYRDAYAGMWTHGEVKGHLFGTIAKFEQPVEAKQ